MFWLFKNEFNNSLLSIPRFSSSSPSLRFSHQNTPMCATWPVYVTFLDLIILEHLARSTKREIIEYVFFSVFFQLRRRKSKYLHQRLFKRTTWLLNLKWIVLLMKGNSCKDCAEIVSNVVVFWGCCFHAKLWVEGWNVGSNGGLVRNSRTPRAFICTPTAIAARRESVRFCVSCCGSYCLAVYILMKYSNI